MACSSYQPRPIAGKEWGKVSQLCVVITVSILSETQMSSMTPHDMAINLGAIEELSGFGGRSGGKPDFPSSVVHRLRGEKVLRTWRLFSGTQPIIWPLLTEAGSSYLSFPRPCWQPSHVWKGSPHPKTRLASCLGIYCRHTVALGCYFLFTRRKEGVKSNLSIEVCV